MGLVSKQGEEDDDDELGEIRSPGSGPSTTRSPTTS